MDCSCVCGAESTFFLELPFFNVNIYVFHSGVFSRTYASKTPGDGYLFGPLAQV